MPGVLFRDYIGELPRIDALGSRGNKDKKEPSCYSRLLRKVIAGIGLVMNVVVLIGIVAVRLMETTGSQCDELVHDRGT